MNYHMAYLDLKAMEARLLNALHACEVAAADAFALLGELRCQQLEFLSALAAL